MQVSLAKYLVLLLRNRILNLGYYSVVTDHPINLQLNANIGTMSNAITARLVLYLAHLVYNIFIYNVVPTTAGEQKVIDTWDLTSLDGAWLPPIQVKCLGYS